jgi:hypothetical protein
MTFTSIARKPGDTLKMTLKEWREINPDWKAIEDGRRYLLQRESGQACLVRVEIVQG